MQYLRETVLYHHSMFAIHLRRSAIGAEFRATPAPEIAPRPGACAQQSPPPTRSQGQLVAMQANVLHVLAYHWLEGRGSLPDDLEAPILEVCAQLGRWCEILPTLRGEPPGDLGELTADLGELTGELEGEPAPLPHPGPPMTGPSWRELVDPR